jgi:DNA-binding XRE family transcriptional regulator
MDSRPDHKFAIARRFKTLRKKALLSQSFLARILGVCRQTVNQIERCRVMPHRKTWDNFFNLEAKHRQVRTVHLTMHWPEESGVNSKKQKKAT